MADELSFGRVYLKKNELRSTRKVIKASKA